MFVCWLKQRKKRQEVAATAFWKLKSGGMRLNDLSRVKKAEDWVAEGGCPDTGRVAPQNPGWTQHWELQVRLSGVER